MATIRDLLARKPERTITTISGILPGHLPELNEWEWWPFEESECRGVDILVMREIVDDHRRFWRLAVVRLDGEPVMVIQNAGREGDDHKDRFVVSNARVAALVARLREELTLTHEEDPPPREHDLDEQIPGLTAFYNHRIED